jgi:hypothetical protein
MPGTLAALPVKASKIGLDGDLGSAESQNKALRVNHHGVSSLVSA